MTKKIEIPGLKDLLEAGVHFGHQSRRWNPKMSPYIFTKRNGVHIFDLEKTQKELEIASQALIEIAKTGAPIIFVCTKRQVKQIVLEGARKAGAMSVTNRWLGGTLTNFTTVQRSLKKYNSLVDGFEKGTFDNLTKKERALLMRQKLRLDKLYSGIKDLTVMPGALVVIDSKRERTAVAEAKIMGVQVFALADTNCDPTHIDYVIPGNDDAFRSVQLILGVLFEAVGAGRAQIGDQGKQEVISEESEKSKRQKNRQVSQSEKSEKTDKPTSVLSDLSGLGLSNRSFNALSKAGIKTLEDLKVLAEGELEVIKGLGKKSLDEIHQLLK